MDFTWRPAVLIERLAKIRRKPGCNPLASHAWIAVADLERKCGRTPVAVEFGYGLVIQDLPVTARAS